MNVSWETQAADQTVPLAGPGILRTCLLRHARLWMSALLAFSDLAGLLIAGACALQLRLLLFAPFDLDPYWRIVPLTGLFLLVYLWHGLYPAIGLGAVEEFRRLTTNTSLVFLSSAALAFAVQSPHNYSRLAFALTWIFALLLLPLGRAAVRAICARARMWGEPVAVVGPVDQAARVCAILRRHPKTGLIPVQVCGLVQCPAGPGHQVLALQENGAAEACQGYPVRLARTAVVIDSDYTSLSAVREKYGDTFERVILVNEQDLGLQLRCVSVQEFGCLTGLEIRQDLLNRWAQVEKRLFDGFASGTALLALAPIFAVLSALIRFDTPGPGLYRQERIGKGGRRFKLLKFRTMHLHAEERLSAYLDADEALRGEWDRYQKLQDDPRITRVGRILRRFSLDELPQLWNVFTGEMSLVGPRPIMPDQQELYGQNLEQYVRVTPGITGLWQVFGRNMTTFARRAELDGHYIKNWSVWLDLYILLRTGWVILQGEGAS